MKLCLHAAKLGFSFSIFFILLGLPGAKLGFSFSAGFAFFFLFSV